MPNGNGPCIQDKAGHSHWNVRFLCFCRLGATAVVTPCCLEAMVGSPLSLINVAVEEWEANCQYAYLVDKILPKQCCCCVTWKRSWEWRGGDTVCSSLILLGCWAEGQGPRQRTEHGSQRTVWGHQRSASGLPLSFCRGLIHGTSVAYQVPMCPPPAVPAHCAASWGREKCANEVTESRGSGHLKLGRMMETVAYFLVL